MKPLLKWAGGKTSLIPQLRKHFPQNFERYVEPFLGGGAIFFSLFKDKKALINDLNSEITRFYEVVRDKPDDLMNCLDKLSNQYSESFYYELRQKKPRGKVQQAARTLFLNKTCFNGLYRQNARGEFNVPFGKRERAPTFYDQKNLLELSSVLKDVVLTNLDFEAVLEEAGGGDFIYCDPPYEPISTTASFRNYTSSGFDEKDLRRLYEACNRAAQRGALVAVSNSDSPLVRRVFKKWRLVRVNCRRSINSKGLSRGPVKEILAKSY